MKKLTFVFACLMTSVLGWSQAVVSRLEVLHVASGKRRVVYEAPVRFEAPNWSRDGKVLLFNQEGRLYEIPVSGGTPKLIDTGLADQCNNDHGYSPDGSQLAISHNDRATGKSLIYTVPSSGGTPRLVTPEGHSYWHGWSPDGRMVVYCAERNGEYDVYRISALGGVEERLTTTPGLDDGPEYSPDGRYIYFNSVRTGNMHLWRMNADGSNATQLTFDDQFNDWFPHPSPNGKHLIFISFGTDVEPGSHPPYKNVSLRLMPAKGGKVKKLFDLFGGQGTINVPSWSPDSQYVAFVSYELK